MEPRVAEDVWTWQNTWYRITPMIKTCRHCGDSFKPYPGKPGYIDECPRCLVDPSRYLPPLPKAKVSKREALTLRVQEVLRQYGVPEPEIKKYVDSLRKPRRK